MRKQALQHTFFRGIKKTLLLLVNKNSARIYHVTPKAVILPYRCNYA